MSLSKPSRLGLISCPGAEAFSCEVIENLRELYLKKNNRIAELLGKKYSLSKEKVIKTINLAMDLHSPLISQEGPVESISMPKFRINVRFTQFSNGEFKAEILDSVRGLDIYIIQDVENHYPIHFHNSKSACPLSVNDHVMVLFATVNAVLEASANSVNVVLPVYPFSRQHRKKGREGLTASWFGRVLEYMGVERIITLDLHSKEIENAFNTLRLENLHASYQTVKKLAEIVDLKGDNLVVISPDTGAVDRNKYYAGNLRRPLGLLYKERDYSKLSHNADESNITTMRLLGSVEGKNVFMADDMLGTGGTIIKAMRYLKELGAKDIIAAVSLPLFSGEAISYFDHAYGEGLFYRIIGTNAVYHGEDLLDKEWYVQADISNLFARVIYRNHHERSVSSLLDDSKMIQRLLYT